MKFFNKEYLNFNLEEVNYVQRQKMIKNLVLEEQVYLKKDNMKFNICNKHNQIIGRVPGLIGEKIKLNLGELRICKIKNLFLDTKEEFMNVTIGIQYVIDKKMIPIDLDGKTSNFNFIDEIEYIEKKIEHIKGNNDEASLFCTCFNLRRMMTLLGGVRPMMKKLSIKQ